MTSRRKSYYATICRLCRELGRPVTAGEVAGAERVTKSTARKAIDELIMQSFVVWCKEGYKRYYWPKGWRPLNWPDTKRRIRSVR